ncbi:DNA polymerase III subunit delta' [Steroidobacter sp. S1-65]|uniref:DNA polymerase III subunit delta' n=1 Tax=Steroidobacter gossypii TaxID=2805490 RepID=A0ABS1WX86_9GAMM|nr:DNA polymerase III subunit delta' [Steroidobacter gossypii]MBM0105581.1 DNA polymerase III subunit delta' [Steroidobacter gossypii]
MAKKDEQPAPQPLPSPRLLPWHSAAISQLRQAWSANRLPHAILVQGAEGLGKSSFAAWLAAAVLCERSTPESLDVCGSCASCALIKAGSHPDLLWVAPEEDKTQLSVDQVRAACEKLSKTSFRQGYKVAIIEPAHQMTPGAANSVLKTLEEPTPGSLLVLLTSRPSSLLPTVRSRCQKLTIARPSESEAMAWLQQLSGKTVSPALLTFSGGAPLRALAYADGQFEALNQHMLKSLRDLLSGEADVTQVAAEWEKDALIDRLVWLDLWLSSLARAAIAGTDERVTFPGGPAHLPSPSRPLNISALYSMVDRTRALKAQLARTALQRELAVESWLIALLEALAPSYRGGAPVARAG